jgi:hypothetical protein
MSYFAGAAAPPGYFNAKSFGYAGTATSDLFSGVSSYLSAGMQAKGLETEATDYTLAATLAGEQINPVTTNMHVQEYQEERNLAIVQGQTEAGAAGGGFTTGGSTLDILKANAAQGATTQAIAEVNGENQIAGLQEQQTAYTNMAAAATSAAKTEEELGTIGLIGGIAGAALNVAAIFAPGK